MGNQVHGTWAQLFEDIHDHEKTGRLAGALRAAGVPPEYARDVAVAQLHRLACWALRDSGTGLVGHLDAAQFAHIVRWPHFDRLQELMDGWASSGFLDHAGTRDATIHDFRDYFRHILRKREERAGARCPPAGRPLSASRARVRKPETGNRKPELEPPHPPADAGPPGAEAAPSKAARRRPKGGLPANPDPEAVAVFDHWRVVCGHHGARLDAKRYGLILDRRREGYSADQLKAAIDGCRRSPFHQGENDRRKVFDGLDLILRDAAHVDALSAVAAGTGTTEAKTKGQAAIEAAERMFPGIFALTPGAAPRAGRKAIS